MSIPKENYNQFNDWSTVGYLDTLSQAEKEEVAMNILRLQWKKIRNGHNRRAMYMCSIHVSYTQDL